jgi:hypothetical protein
MRGQEKERILQLTAVGFHGWLAAFCLTLLVEVPVVIGLARRLDPRPARRAALALLGNAITHPAVWFVFPSLGLGWAATTLLSETWAWLGEGVLYRIGLARARLGPALVLSLAANLLSFSLGLALWAAGVLS